MRQVTSDTEAQALYVRIVPGEVATSPEVPVTCVLDLDKGGKVLGIELLGLVIDLGPDVQINISSAPDVRVVPVPLWPRDRWIR